MFSVRRLACTTALVVSLVGGCSGGSTRLRGEVGLGKTARAVDTVAGVGDGFVAVIDTSEVLTSPGGVAWTKQSGASRTFKGLRVRAIRKTAFGVMAAAEDDGRVVVLLSPDALVWRRVDDSSAFRLDGGHIVALLEDSAGVLLVRQGRDPGLLRSADGLTWTRGPDGLGLRSGENPTTGWELGGGRVLVLGTGKEGATGWVENDQGTWTRSSLGGLDSGTPRSCAAGRSGIVAVGSGRRIPGETERQLAWASPDGRSWRVALPATAANHSRADAIAATDHGYLIAGSRLGRVALWSGDPSGWRSLGLGGARGGSASIAVSAGGLVVAVSDDGRAGAVALSR